MCICVCVCVYVCIRACVFVYAYFRVLLLKQQLIMYINSTFSCIYTYTYILYIGLHRLYIYKLVWIQAYSVVVSILISITMEYGWYKLSSSRNIVSLSLSVETSRNNIYLKVGSRELELLIKT